MKFISRKFITALVTLIVLSGTALATSSAQGQPTQDEAGPMRILVHGNW